MIKFCLFECNSCNQTTASSRGCLQLAFEGEGEGKQMYLDLENVVCTCDDIMSKACRVAVGRYR